MGQIRGVLSGRPHPGPFNGTTGIPYLLAASGPVRLAIFNTLGQPVRTLVDEFQTAGSYQVSWDARDQQGAAVATGVYLTRDPATVPELFPYRPTQCPEQVTPLTGGPPPGLGPIALPHNQMARPGSPPAALARSVQKSWPTNQLP